MSWTESDDDDVDETELEDMENGLEDEVMLAEENNDGEDSVDVRAEDSIMLAVENDEEEDSVYVHAEDPTTNNLEMTHPEVCEEPKDDDLRKVLELFGRGKGTPVFCQFCLIVLDSMNLYIHHAISHHESCITKLWIRCQDCRFYFPNMEVMVLHKQKFHEVNLSTLFSTLETFSFLEI